MECRLCRSSELTLFYTQGNFAQYKYYRCKNCGLVNYDMQNKPDQEKYTQVYIDPEQEKHFLNQRQKASHKFLRKHLEPKGKMLDVGCGNGLLLLLAKKDGWEVTGMELSKLYADELEKRYNIPVITANFLTFEPASTQKYDVIVMLHVLEHFPDPILAMKKLHQLLDEGGISMLEFPNIDGVEARFRRFLARTGIYHRKYADDYVPGHCHEFSKKPFLLLCGLTGFEILVWETYSSKSWLNTLYKVMPFGSKVRVLIRKSQVPV